MEIVKRKSVLEYFTLKWLHYCKKIRITEIKRSLRYCGFNVTISDTVIIEGGFNVSLQNNIGLASFVHIWGQGGLEIGEDTMIASHVALSTLTHDTTYEVYNKSLISKPIKIGRNVWIGSHSFIHAGVTIGDNTIVGAGSIVLNDLESNSLYAGVPAKLIRRI